MPQLHSRRHALITALLAAAAGPASAKAAAGIQPEPMAPQSPGLGDFDWLVGRWKVRHHRLKERLAGSHDWEDFDGTSQEWLTLGGYGTIDDNVIELPSGTYRAMGFRAYNPDTRQWSVWWLDARRQTIDPPVRGGFAGGRGVFVGDDVLRGMPVKVRFIWSDITPASARWEQAFSPDGGRTWEMNWSMQFTRA
jgi:hypothetical protein